MTIYHIVPLVSGFIYALAALFMKRATEAGVGITRNIFLTQWFTLLLFLPVLFTKPQVLDWSRWWAPLLTGCIEFVGAVFLCISIRSGAISIQTPLMGTKVLFVATFSLFIIPGPIPIQWWFGAITTFVAVLMLGLPDVLNRLVSPQAIFSTLTSAAFFGLADVFIEREAPLFGKIPFLLLLTTFMSLFSLILIPFFPSRIKNIPRGALKWLFAGSFSMALQLAGLFYTLAFFGQATVVNVLYAVRGFWSILLIWFVGHLFANKEKSVGLKVMLRRFAAASLLFLAIIIILR